MAIQKIKKIPSEETTKLKLEEQRKQSRDTIDYLNELLITTPLDSFPLVYKSEEFNKMFIELILNTLYQEEIYLNNAKYDVRYKVLGDLSSDLIIDINRETTFPSPNPCVLVAYSGDALAVITPQYIVHLHEIKADSNKLEKVIDLQIMKDKNNKNSQNIIVDVSDYPYPLVYSVSKTYTELGWKVDIVVDADYYNRRRIVIKLS